MIVLHLTAQYRPASVSVPPTTGRVGFFHEEALGMIAAMLLIPQFGGVGPRPDLVRRFWMINAFPESS